MIHHANRVATGMIAIAALLGIADNQTGIYSSEAGTVVWRIVITIATSSTIALAGMIYRDITKRLLALEAAQHKTSNRVQRLMTLSLVTQVGSEDKANKMVVMMERFMDADGK